jgi:hypothetical protein
MSDDSKLPTLGEAISSWLGIQLPTIAMPQTLRNLDKAVSKIALAAGENIEARIKANTGKTKARGKIDVTGMFRNDEEKRKLENRAETTKIAIEDLRKNPGEKDAQAEIEDDWLNLFARLAEDKSSEELKHLFGKILAGEIRRPGSFSLRTIQLMATVSKQEAEEIADFLSYALRGVVVPFTADEKDKPTLDLRMKMAALAIAGHPVRLGGLAHVCKVASRQQTLMAGSKGGILLTNGTSEDVEFHLGGQILTEQARELLPIANPKPTDLEFLKGIAQGIYNDLRGRFSEAMDAQSIVVDVILINSINENAGINYTLIHRATVAP